VIVTKPISLAATQLVEDPSKPNQLEANVVRFAIHKTLLALPI
jgi:hypothetical protein